MSKKLSVELLQKTQTIDRKFFDGLGLTDKFNEECAKNSPAGFHVDLFPDEKFSQIHVTLKLEGVNNAIANALRMVICAELPVFALWAKGCPFSTTDEFLIHEEIVRRLATIPLSQKCPADAKFSLDVANNSAESVYVTTAHLKQTAGRAGQYFDKNYCLFKLDAGKCLSCKDIGILMSPGDVEGMGMFTVAHNVISIVDIDGLTEDEQPLNLYTKKGIPAGRQNYSRWLVKFCTNGTMKPEEIVKAACSEISERLKNVGSRADTFVSIKNEHILSIPAESSTVGNLIIRAAVDANPNCTISYSVDGNNTLKIRLLYDDDPKTFIGRISEDLSAVFDNIAEKI